MSPASPFLAWWAPASATNSTARGGRPIGCPELVPWAFAWAMQPDHFLRYEQGIEMELTAHCQELMGIESGASYKNLVLPVGICGERGVAGPYGGGICHQVGLGCVSCSPFRVPTARLAAAQAALAAEAG